MVYGDGDGEEDIWFQPDVPPPGQAVDGDTVDSFAPFELVVDDDSAWPDDMETKPDHESRIEDVDGYCWYRTKTAACDALYTETVEVAVANIGDFIEGARLAYERPGVFIGHHRESSITTLSGETRAFTGRY